MPRKRRKFELIERNKPNRTALPLEIGLNLPCMKGYYDAHDRYEDESNLGELGVKYLALTED